MSLTWIKLYNYYDGTIRRKIMKQRELLKNMFGSLKKIGGSIVLLLAVAVMWVIFEYFVVQTSVLFVAALVESEVIDFGLDAMVMISILVSTLSCIVFWLCTKIYRKVRNFLFSGKKLSISLQGQIEKSEKNSGDDGKS
jgi:hypothetical protein